MIFLLGSIVLTSYLTLWFKVTQRFGISNLQTIVYNYITCVITGSLVNGHFPIDRESMELPWFGWACAMGFVFILLFNLVGFTTQRIGVAVTSVANKLSLVIPFVFSIYLYNEKATALKIAGVIVALLAVLLTCWPKREKEKQKEKEKEKQKGIVLLVGLTFLLFIASGMLDTMIKYVEHHFVSEQNKNDYLVTAFTSAATIGILLLIFAYSTGKEKFQARAVLSGILLGIPNYFSIWCLIKVLNEYGDNSSAMIPINDMGIVLFSTVMAWLIFKERLSTINWIGILLSMMAIAFIAYG